MDNTYPRYYFKALIELMGWNNNWCKQIYEGGGHISVVVIWHWFICAYANSFSSCCVGVDMGGDTEAFHRRLLPSVTDSLLSLASRLMNRALAVRDITFFWCLECPQQKYVYSHIALCRGMGSLRCFVSSRKWWALCVGFWKPMVTWPHKVRSKVQYQTDPLPN